MNGSMLLSDSEKHEMIEDARDMKQGEVFNDNKIHTMSQFILIRGLD